MKGNKTINPRKLSYQVPRLYKRELPILPVFVTVYFILLVVLSVFVRKYLLPQYLQVYHYAKGLS